MPMKASRVAKFLTSGKGKIRYDRKLKLHFLELFVEPSGEHLQTIRLGNDPGSCFDGFSIVSKDTHHENYELVQRDKKGKTSISAFKKRQSTNRRVRRSRLWHRKIRFINRTKNKLAPTIQANNDFRKWLVIKICCYYPISEVELEDVRFNHAENTNGKSFSHVELGKKDMENFYRNTMKLQLTLTGGWETARYRKELNGGVDVKVKKKDSKEFNAHCIDSYILGCEKEYRYDEALGDYDFERKYVKFAPVINTKVVYIQKQVKIRRCLTRTRKKYKNACKYYKQSKGRIKTFTSHMSKKRNICRVKPKGEHSNHPKKWKYIDNGVAEKFKCSTAPYGGTRINGKTFFKLNEWYNRTIVTNYG